MADDFLAMIEELFASVGTVRLRRMFGGHGVYLDGNFVAIVWREQLYLKADESTAAEFEAAGLERFRPTAKADYSLGFYTAPVEALEDPEQFRLWAIKAKAAAVRSARGKSARIPSRSAAKGGRRP
jgi:DNA transformation protein